jgi:hypothetical protein
MILHNKKMPRRLTIAAVLALLAWPHTAFANSPIKTLHEIGPALTACWEPPVDIPGGEVTIRLSLKRNGDMLGEARITYSRLVGDPEDQKRFVLSVLAGIAACLPLNITDSLGGSVAGRVFTIRFRSGDRQDAV